MKIKMSRTYFQIHYYTQSKNSNINYILYFVYMDIDLFYFVIFSTLFLYLFDGKGSYCDIF